MPYVTEWVPAEIALEYNGFTVYHAYEEEDFNDRFVYWFTGEAFESSPDCFDVREFSKNSEPKEALKEMIDSGEYQKLIEKHNWEDAIE
jgi:hypothetical protein